MLIVGLMVGALLTVAGASFAQAAAAPRPSLGTLLFASDRDGDLDVYAVAARGGSTLALTRNHDDDTTATLGATLVRSWRERVFVLRADGRWGPVANGVLAGVFDRGRRVAVREGSRMLLLADVSGGQQRRVPLLGEPNIAPDGRNVAFVIEGGGGERPGVVLIEVATGRKSRLATGSDVSLSWSPDGSRLLIAPDSDNARKDYWVAAAASGRLRLFARGDLGWGTWSPDGRWILFTRSVESGALLTVVDARSGRRWESRAQGYPSNLTWSSDGSHFAYYDYDYRSGVYRVVLANAKARVSRTIARSARLVSGPLWSSDGRRFGYVALSSDSEMSLSIAGVAGAARTLVRGDSVALLGWNPDSKRLLFATRSGIGVIGIDGRVRGLSRKPFRDLASTPVWSPSGEAVAFTAGHNGQSVYVLGADGKRLVRLTRRGHDEILAWRASPPPRRARLAPTLASTERAAARTLDTRGPVVAVSALGAAVGVLVADHELDCTHPVVWRPGRPVTRIGTPAPCRREGGERPLDVELTAGSVLWSEYSCGSDCDVTRYRAARSATDVVTVVGESTSDDAPEPPLPPTETRRGVSIVVAGGVVRLRRLSDGVEQTIAATGARIFDAELEDEGLFYAINRPRGEFRGRVTFLPFDELFSEP